MPYQIDLKKSGALTLQSVKVLLASGDDSHMNQVRVTKNGIAYLSQDVVGNLQTDDLAFRLETFNAGTGHVGFPAAGDDAFAQRILAVLQANWPNPSSTYIDIF